jgi:hypothetical protein
MLYSLAFSTSIRLRFISVGTSIGVRVPLVSSTKMVIIKVERWKVRGIEKVER